MSAAVVDTDDLWVFAYGSLMWQPGFAPAESVQALLHGYHRALCVYSVRYRGSSERPGLVFGLDLGGACEGMAMKIAPGDREHVLKYLRDREQVTGIYRAQTRQVLLRDGSHRRVRALCFVAERWHPQRVEGLSLKDRARVVLASRGIAGRNIDYVLSTLRHLRELDIHDDLLERLVTLTGCHRHLRIPEGVPANGAVRTGRLTGTQLAYPFGHTPRLPPGRVLRCNHRRNLGY